MVKNNLVMKILPILLVFLGLSLNLSAQFGLKGKYVKPGNNWQLMPSGTGQEETTDLFDKGWSAGVDYWFRLKNKRVEFLPELNYMQLGNSLPAYAENQAKVYSFFFNTNIYFLDFAGDCDCPTWSKEGPTLEKGLFLQLSPGASYWDATIGADDFYLANRTVVFSIGGALGFDLGLSDLITLTPMVNARYFPSVKLENVETLNSQLEGFVSSDTANPLLWSAGLRLGVRLDQ